MNRNQSATIRKQLTTAVRANTKALGVLNAAGLSWTLTIPIALNLVLFFSGIAGVNSLTDYFMEFDLFQEPTNWSFWGGEVLLEIIYWLIWLVLKIMYFLIFAYLGGFVVLILIAPLLAFVSEQVNRHLTGEVQPFQLRSFIKELWRGVLLATRNLFFEILWITLFFATSFIPVIGWLSPFALFLVSSYYYGFSFIDYNNERHGVSRKESVVYSRKHWVLLTANGMAFSAFLLIPFIGTFLAGIAAILNTTAGTIAYNELQPTSTVANRAQVS